MNQDATALTFESFWNWLIQHPNCILRAGTAEAVVFDGEELHWAFFAEEGVWYVQAIHGKRVAGEIIVDPDRISYVQTAVGDREEEFVFELIQEAENDRFSAYFFVMVHGLEEEEEEVESHHRSVH